MDRTLEQAALAVIVEIEQFDKESCEAEHTDVSDVWCNIERWKHSLQAALGVPETPSYEEVILG